MQTCKVQSDTRMQCTSPSLRQSTLNSTHLSSISPHAYQLSYGFILDGVMSVRNLSRPATLRRMFLVYPDPRFHRFDGAFKRFFYLPNEYLTINVRSTAVKFGRSTSLHLGPIIINNLLLDQELIIYRYSSDCCSSSCCCYSCWGDSFKKSPSLCRLK